MSIEIVLPWPPASLSPNARMHHMALYRAKKAYRQICFWQAMEQGLKPSKAERLSVHFEFYKANNRPMDLDNMLGRMKAGIDGLADVLGVDDSRWEMSFKFSEEIGGFVRVTISEVSA